MSSSDKWDPRAETPLDPKFNTGVGNPLSPYNEELLSEEDEKRIDDKGRLVVEGKPWSQASSGQYMHIAMHTAPSLGCDRPRVGASCIQVSPEWNLSVGVTYGKPVFLHPIYGASIELPDDLGKDSIKRQYLAEWIKDTVLESLTGCSLRVPKDKLSDLAVAVALASNHAIEHSGF